MAYLGENEAKVIGQFSQMALAIPISTYAARKKEKASETSVVSKAFYNRKISDDYQRSVALTP